MSNYERPKYELVDATSYASTASDNVNKLLDAFTDLRQTIALRDLAIEELDRKLEALEEAYKESEQLKVSYLEQLRAANARADKLEAQLLAAILTPTEEKAEEAPLDQPHDTSSLRDHRHEGAFLRPYDDKNDTNTDTTQHQAGNIFGADE